MWVKGTSQHIREGAHEKDMGEVRTVLWILAKLTDLLVSDHSTARGLSSPANNRLLPSGV